MQYRSVIGARSRYASPCKVKQFKNIYAPMQYRHENEHAPANLALTEQWFLLTTAHFACAPSGARF